MLPLRAHAAGDRVAPPDSHQGSTWDVLAEETKAALACFDATPVRIITGGRYHPPAGCIDPKEGEVLARRTLAESYRFGETDPRYFESANMLGRMLREGSKLDEAVSVVQDALESGTKALGPDHVVVVESLRVLTRLQCGRGDDDCLAMYERLLSAQKTVEGPESLSAAATIDALAGLRFYREEYEQAIEGYQRALKIRSKRLGPSHADTLKTLRMLGLVEKEMGRESESRSIFERLFRIEVKLLDDEDPGLSALLSRIEHELAHRQDEPEERPGERSDLSLELSSRASRLLDAVRRVHGDPSRCTLACALLETADLCRDRDLLEDAESLYELALDLDEHAGRGASPEALESLARVKQRLSKPDQARTLYERAIVIGWSDDSACLPRTLTDGYAEVLRTLGKSERAAEVERRAAAFRHSGPDALYPLGCMDCR